MKWIHQEIRETKDEIYLKRKRQTKTKQSIWPDTLNSLAAYSSTSIAKPKENPLKVCDLWRQLKPERPIPWNYACLYSPSQLSNTKWDINFLLFCLDHEKFEGKYEEREIMKKGKIRRKSKEENTNWFKFNNFFIQCLSNCVPLLERKNGEFRNIEAFYH